MIDQESDMMNKQRTELFVTLSLKLYDYNCFGTSSVGVDILQNQKRDLSITLRLVWQILCNLLYKEQSYSKTSI